ncbi:pentapeptide repeat-containing protein [Pantoea ananatis]|uniref:pentapeptide repeat-containing protein n=1 Tax=Pantoea ananas TaxID=553 RepID=UPI001E618843|nr:pentapeptide repeat-containing protein [Pantoea ananatis]
MRFSKSKPVINVDDAVCEASHFVKAKFVAGSSGIEYGGRRVRFVDCDFTGTVFDRVEFRATKYINCTFTDAKLKNVTFVELSLRVVFYQ